MIDTITQLPWTDRDRGYCVGVQDAACAICAGCGRKFDLYDPTDPECPPVKTGDGKTPSALFHIEHRVTGSHAVPCRAVAIHNLLREFRDSHREKSA